MRTLSAGIVPVRRERGQWLFLLLRAYSYWDFPKGVVEPGEEPMHAALRELEEETGLIGAEFRWGPAFHETEPYSRGKVARYYLAAVPDDAVQIRPNPRNGNPEHHEYRWLSYEDARRILGPRVREVLDWANERIQGQPRLRSSA